MIWVFGPIVKVGAYEPFASDNVRIVIIALLVIFWLIWLIVAQRRAIRANRLFVAEIAAPVVEKPLGPGEENVAAVGAKFAEVMAELKRRKLGGRKFLREMPWYVIVGPPATGKTTALRQSGLTFPIDLTDDLQGVGGTRNCDWFFSENAVLIDTAGRYVQQESQPDVDAAEWLGFLDLLKKHRGRRALNGVIVALSIDTLSEGDEAIKAHGRKIRRRLAELNDRLEIRLPVYLMLTKADLIKGFEPFFGGLSTASREQVWGTTFALDARIDAKTIEREITTLAAELERRLVPRLEDEDKLASRAEIFRFPAQPPASPNRSGADRGNVRREPLRGGRLAARPLSDIGDPGRRAHRPADRGIVVLVRSAAATRHAGAKDRKTQLLPEEPFDRGHLQRGRSRYL
ncbi:hypothetical protein AJ88_26985 [Mesorhizobium amorphae CCBAU 01583]|nr:hypothetical protein AJ88_26985 [Mesorhizobium amorphae CCBAU 01583]